MYSSTVFTALFGRRRMRDASPSAVELENEGIQELQVISGTFNAEYGNAMSGDPAQDPFTRDLLEDVLAEQLPSEWTARFVRAPGRPSGRRRESDAAPGCRA